MYTNLSFCIDAKAIGNAINKIVAGKSDNISISEEVRVYKVPSTDPEKYTIRIDIKEEGDSDCC